jgi:LysR family glycine cleavage system transcriptional activator
MAHRPPPFAALRALEAACRHRSYTAAAAELNVTHSAVSQAVRRLEEEVGAKLFHRRGANMEPAAASLSLARAYAEASQSVGRAMRHISESSPNSLTVRLPARLARLWLTPLLPNLSSNFPAVGLCLRTEGAGDPEVDLAFQASPPRSGAQGIVFGDLSLRAYASPGLLRQYALDRPESLTTAPLLIEQDGYDWAAWFAAADVAPDTALRGLRFDDNSGLALDAAVRGLGIVLCDELSAQLSVERGELMPVCANVSTPGDTLWAVWQAEHPKSGLIEPLAAWLCGEAKARPLPVIARLRA